MQISNPVEITYLLLAFMFLGGILLGSFLRTCHMHRYTTVVGGAIGMLLGFALIESLPLLL